LIYAIQYGEKSFSAWAPIMWPIKVVLNLGIFLMLLQSIAIVFKDWATLKGKPLT
jgi:TRAP-type mannitol/chloroaromatic compound transport system permease small subunit